jgi:hypothetical protein
MANHRVIKCLVHGDPTHTRPCIRVSVASFFLPRLPLTSMDGACTWHHGHRSSLKNNFFVKDSRQCPKKAERNNCRAEF